MAAAVVVAAVGDGTENRPANLLPPKDKPHQLPHRQTHVQAAAHLFQCPANPTNLEPRILWEDPQAAAVFLDLPTNQDLDLDDND